MNRKIISVSQIITSQVLTFLATDKTKTITLPLLRGIIAEVDFSVPVWTEAVDTTLSIERPDGTVVFAGAPRAKGNAILFFVEFPKVCMVGNEIVRITLSDVPGVGGGALMVSVFGRRG